MQKESRSKAGEVGERMEAIDILLYTLIAVSLTASLTAIVIRIIVMRNTRKRRSFKDGHDKRGNSSYCTDDSGDSTNN